MQYGGTVCGVFDRIKYEKLTSGGLWLRKCVLCQPANNLSVLREEKKLTEIFLLAHSLLDTPSRDQIHDGNVFMKTNNLKIFTNAYFSLFLILSYDLAANSLSRKKNWIVFAVENIKNIDFGDFFRKHEKKSKCADFEKFQHFRWIWHFFRFFTLRGTCGCSMFFSYIHSSELHSDFRNLVFTHFPKF